MAATDAAQVLAGIKALIANPPEDKAVRQELYEAIKDLSVAIEDPHDTIYRVVYSELTLPWSVVADDLGLFEQLAKSEKPLTVSELSKKKSADEVLTARILRYLASQKMIVEVGEDTFAANNITRTLSDPGNAAGLRHNFDSHYPCAGKIPQLLADTKYANPSDMMHSAFQIALNTDLPPFVWALSQPRMVQDFQLWMQAVYGGRPTSWLDAYDITKHLEGAKEEEVIFVDVAGGIGHQCALLKGKYPELKGRVILQDLPMVIPQAIPVPGVEAQGVDMWQGQAVKGAKTYYMRMILHDYADDKATALLKITAEAMGPDSILVIDDLVIPNKGAHGHSTQFDLIMMASLSSIERTDKQWIALLDAAGFEILSKKAYAPTGESAIVVKPKKA